MRKVWLKDLVNTCEREVQEIMSEVPFVIVIGRDIKKLEFV